jgi:predicted RNA-binding protein YlqC (UPF0109 family)
MLREDKDMEMKNLIRDIIKELVDSPDDVDVEEIKTNSTAVINIKVAKGDLGKVIGRKGRIITSLRTVFGSIYSKNNLKLIIESSSE